MTNPTTGWDKVPVTGTYKLLGGGFDSGSLTFTLSERIIATDGSGIYARGQKITVPISDTDGTVSVNFPASDDPDISPTGWSIYVEENLKSKGGQKYYIQPKLADIDDGFNLNDVVVSSDAPSAPPPVYARSQPGGIAGLDTDGDVINAAGEKVTGGDATSFASLSDVDMSGATAGQVPVYDGTEYKPGDPGASKTTELSDWSTTAATDGQVPTWDADTSEWVPSDAPSGGDGADATTDLTDWSSTAPTDGQVPQWDSDSSEYVPGDLSVAAGDVSGLATVATTGSYNDLSDQPTIPASAADIDAVPDTRTINGKPLSADVTLGAADISDLAAVASSNDYGDLDNTPDLALVATSGDLSDLNGIDLSTAPTDGQTLVYDTGTSVFKPGTISGGTGAVDSVNGQTGAVTLDASDIDGAVPDTRTINGKPLSADITLGPSDLSGLATVATTGAYTDLTGTPTLATVATSGKYEDLTGAPDLATVAESGDYADLSNKPTAADIGALDASATVPLANIPDLFGAINRESGGTYPSRPSFTGTVVWIGADQPDLEDMQDDDLWLTVT